MCRGQASDDDESGCYFQRHTTACLDKPSISTGSESHKPMHGEFTADCSGAEARGSSCNEQVVITNAPENSGVQSSRRCCSEEQDLHTEREDAFSDQQVMDGLVNVLTQLALQPSSGKRCTKFHCSHEPNIRIGEYVIRLRTYFKCSDVTFFVALMYFDRIVKRHPGFEVCNLSCHRTYLIALIVAIKYTEDTYYPNSYYAKVGGLPVQQLNILEKRFLALIEWKLTVQPEEYALYCETLAKAASGFNGNN